MLVTLIILQLHRWDLRITFKGNKHTRYKLTRNYSCAEIKDLSLTKKIISNTKKVERIFVVDQKRYSLIMDLFLLISTLLCN